MPDLKEFQDMLDLQKRVNKENRVWFVLNIGVFTIVFELTLIAWGIIDWVL